MDKDSELRGWKAHCVELQGQVERLDGEAAWMKLIIDDKKARCVELQDRVDRLELENSRLKDVIDAANAQAPVYQWRIDGDEGWIDCTKEWFDEIYYSHENRILYASPIPAKQSIEQAHMSGQADAQEPSHFAREGGGAVSAEILEAATDSQKELYCIPLYARPIPAQQSQVSTSDKVLFNGSHGHAGYVIEEQQSQSVAVTEDNAWIIEKLSYHKFERDDLSIDDCLKYLSSEWTEVAGRTTRQLVMQILYLLASSQLPRVTEREAKNG